MSLNLSKSKEWSEIIKNYVQALAFVIAGIWTYNTFLKKEAPGLESVVTLHGKLSKYSTANDQINKFAYDVNLKNEGVSAIDISKVKISVWKFTFNVKNITQPTYINIEQIQKTGTLLFEKIYPNAEDKISTDIIFPLIQHYPPNASY